MNKCLYIYIYMYASLYTAASLIIDLLMDT